MSSKITLFLFLIFAQGAAAQLFEQPESIVFDELNQRYIVSNSVSSSMVAVNSEGQQSKFGLKGTGSHGLAISDGVLFSCNKNVVYSYDLRSDRLLGKHSIEGAVFINGFCSDGDNGLFAADFTKRVIYKLTHTGEGALSHEKIASVNQIPNGLAFDEANNRLVIVTWGKQASILGLDLSDGSVSTLRKTTYDNLESVVIDEDGDFFITAWIPAHLLHFNESENRLVELNIADVERPTGLTFDIDGSLIMLSASSNEWKDIDVEAMTKVGVSNVTAFPNPVVTNSMVTYEVESEGTVDICIYDCRGKMVQRLEKSQQDEGTHQYLFDRRGIPAGMYFVNMRTAAGNTAMPITVVD